MARRKRARGSKTFGEYLRREREKADLSQLELARLVKVSGGGVIGNIETGLNMPRVDTLAQLGTKLGWDFNRVMLWFGAELDLEGLERLSSAMTVRPELRRLAAAAAELDNEHAGLLADTAEAWRSRVA